MKDTIFNDVIVAADKNTVIAGIRDFKSSNVPIVTEDLEPAVGGAESLAGKVQDRFFVAVGEDILSGVGATVVAAFDGDR